MQEEEAHVKIWEQRLCRTRLRESRKAASEQLNPISRTQFERDYDRILFCAPVRRLADKTQVFPLEPNDSVRTRLTHSQEVAAIARQMGVEIVCRESGTFSDTDRAQKLREIPPLLAAVGLAHDIGNPPFGHQGELAIQEWVKRQGASLLDGLSEEQSQDFLRFEGNAQALRILGSLQAPFGEFGLNLTVATLASLMKYPVAANGVSKGDCRRKKFGYFQSEKELANLIWMHVGLAEGRRHPLTWIMEAADDIAYRCLDVEDAVKKRLASYDDLRARLKGHAGKGGGSNVGEDLLLEVISATDKCHVRNQQLGQASEELDDLTMQMFRVHAITALTSSACRAFRLHRDEILAGEFKESLLDASSGHLLGKALKEFAKETAYSSRPVLKLEAQGFAIIQETMDILWKSICRRSEKSDILSRRFDPRDRYVFSRISRNYVQIAADGENDLPLRYREIQLLIDMISGMTDSFLVQFHRDLKRCHG